MTLVVTSCGGGFPTQAEGTIHGCPFYFRARWGDWSLTVAPPGGDPIAGTKAYVHYVRGNDPSGGVMERAAVEAILWENVDAVAAKLPGYLEEQAIEREAEAKVRRRNIRQNKPLRHKASRNAKRARRALGRAQVLRHRENVEFANTVGAMAGQYLAAMMRNPSYIDQLFSVTKVQRWPRS